MAERFETSVVPPQDQPDFWLELTSSRLQVKMDLQLEQRSRFAAAMEVQPVGGLELIHVASESADIVREPWHIRSSDPEIVVLQVTLAGSTRFEQDGHAGILTPGDLGILDITRPGRLHYSAPVDYVMMALPRGLLLARLGLRRLPGSVCIAGQHGVGALASSFLRTLYQQSEALDAEAAAVAVEQAVGLVSLALGRAGTQPSNGSGDDETRLAQVVQLGRLRQIQAYIEAHLADPELCPEHVAAANRMSLRYLYKLFARAELSVSEWIRERRLARCAEALASPALAERSVAELAFSWGFADQSHFSRAFKQRFGVSPREYRRQAIASAPVPCTATMSS